MPEPTASLAAAAAAAQPPAALPAAPAEPAGVPLCDLARQAASLEPALTEAARRVLTSGVYVLGAEVEAFERELAAVVGVRHAVGVASGTDALDLALRAVGVRPGDHVLTSPFTFVATVSAILAAGAEPVFADIDPRTGNLDPERVREVLEDRSPVARRRRVRPETVRAIVPVHLYGRPADTRTLRGFGLPVVEDAAQALGATVQGRSAGALGAAGCFSFFPTKNLGGFGDGGMVTTDDAAVADRVRLLRAHGMRPRYTHLAVGTNSRLDALQAALLRVKLPHLPAWVAARRRHAEAYTAALAGLPGLTVPVEDPGSRHAWHQYTVRIGGDRRDTVREALRADGIATAVYYPSPAHLQEALAGLGHRPGDFPHAERACREVLSLPLFPELTAPERTRVTTALRGAV